MRHIHPLIHIEMKKILIIALVLFTMTGAAVSQNTYEKLTGDAIPTTGLDKATSLGEKIMEGQRSGKIYLPTENEAIPQVVKGLTEGVQRSSYESIRGLFGEYRSMQFAEAWKMEADQTYIIYRFKGTFDGTGDKPEIRITLDSNNKLAGLWIMPWKDDLKGTP